MDQFEVDVVYKSWKDDGLTDVAARTVSWDRRRAVIERCESRKTPRGAGTNVRSSVRGFGPLVVRQD